MSVPLTIRPRLTATDDGCPLCGWWRCRCAEILSRAVPTLRRALTRSAR